jgi:CRP-like cAMP-binding protein/HEAT repeat protein
MSRLGRLLNVRPDEVRRTALLYLLCSITLLGYVWGSPASRALFIKNIGLGSYSFLFIVESVFTLALTLVYAAFVDRVSNARLMSWICVITGIALLLIGLLLITRLPIAFYLFYLIGCVVRVIFAVHVWTYVADFYDTRTAKRLYPLIGSAGRVTGFLGGLAFPFLVRVIHTENTPFIWAGLMAVSVWLAASIPHWTGNAASFKAPGRTMDALENFWDGWRSIRDSNLLRLLAIGAMTMTLLLALLNFQVDYVFSKAYQDADELASLFALLTGLANAIALPFQLFLLARIVNRIGVSGTNLLYPLLAVSSYGLLSTFALLPLAVLGHFVRTAFLWGIRNPVDNMLYNAVPRVVKGRARAFINGMLVPMATFLAGVVLFLVPGGTGLPWYVSILGGLAGLAYLASTWRTHSAYRDALVNTLSAEDTALYHLAGTEWDASDRAALDQVLERLRVSLDQNNESEIIFLAQLAYEIGGHDALPTLSEIVTTVGATPGARPKRSPVVRAAILETVGATGATSFKADQLVRQLCTTCLTDPAPIVRRVALSVLEEQRGPEDLPLLAQALDLLQDPDPGVRVRAISLLLRSGDFYYLTAAAGALNELLDDDDRALRALALSTLGEMRDPRFVRTLVPHLEDSSEGVRRAAAQAVAAIASVDAPSWACELALEAAQQALSDRAEAVRLAAVQILAKLAPSQTRPVLLEALQDQSYRVRDNARQVLESMGADAVSELERLLDTEDKRARESAIVALLHLSTEQYRDRAEAELQGLSEQAYRNILLMDALAPLDFSGAALAVHTLKDRNQALLDQIFRVLAAVHGDEAVEVTRRNLQADGHHPANRQKVANAIEALETMTSPLMARLIAPLSAANGSRGFQVTEQMLNLAQEEIGLPVIDPEAALDVLIQDYDPWLTAVGVHLNSQISTRLERSKDDKLAVRRVGKLARLKPKEVPIVSEEMLSTVEKVIFLKEVPIFNEMTVAQIRTLAGIAEELSFDEDEIIFRESEPGDTLYVVVSGRVGLEHEAESGSGSVARLATLKSRQYFGEMSLFDQAPRSATAIAIEQTILLSIRREPLIALVEGDPTLALELIRVLSQRLREANEQLARKTKAAPRKLQKLYDQLM